MISTPDGLSYNSPIYLMTSTPVKKPSAIKSLCFFTNILYAKEKSAIRRVRYTKSKRKAIKYVTTPW